MKIVLSLICLALFSCASVQMPQTKSEDKDITKINMRDIKGSFLKTCLEGHLYYIYNGNGAGFAAVLDNTGKPIKCD